MVIFSYWASLTTNAVLVVILAVLTVFILAPPERILEPTDLTASTPVFKATNRASIVPSGQVYMWWVVFDKT
jgi:hypothetical protein